MNTIQKLRIYLWGAFALAVFNFNVSYAKPMKSSDYFESKQQVALADAVAKGNTDEIKRLVADGADINGQGKEKMTVLVWAILHEDKKAFQFLLENGADPNIQMTESSLTSDGLTDGNSAVSLAAMHEDVWYLEQALRHGGNPNVFNPVKSVTAIFQCIKLYDSNHTRLEHLALMIQAKADLNARDKNGLTPMMVAAMANRYDMVYAMLEAGADPTLKNKWGYTILFQIRTIRTDPAHPLGQWRSRVIAFIKAKGMDVEK